MWMRASRKGVKDVPISAQGLPAIRWEGLPASGWFTRRSFYPPSLWRIGGFTRRVSGGVF